MTGISHQGDRVRPEPEAEFHRNERKIETNAKGEGARVVRRAIVVAVVVVRHRATQEQPGRSRQAALTPTLPQRGRENLIRNPRRPVANSKSEIPDPKSEMIPVLNARGRLGNLPH